MINRNKIRPVAVVSSGQVSVAILGGAGWAMTPGPLYGLPSFFLNFPF